jgi:uncharacterized delta-60 repeat protein
MRTICFIIVAILFSSVVRAQTPLGLDTNFRQTVIEEEGISAVYPLADGKVWISGYWTYPPLWEPQLWGRLLADGSMDLSIPPESGPGVGQIVRYADHYYIDCPFRFDLDGVFDPDFYSPPPPPWTEPNGLGFGSAGFWIQPDGKRIATGEVVYFTPFGVNEANVHYATHRYLSEVQYLDSTFHNGAANGSGEKIFGLPDGRMLVSGRFTQFNGRPTGSLVRIWPDGQLDTTFQSPITGLGGGYAWSFSFQPNGRLVLGGAFIVENDPDTMNLIRLLPDGALDTTFHNHTEFRSYPETNYGELFAIPRDIEALEDGRLLVAGNFTHIDGHLRRSIALLDSTGHLITTAFNGQGCGLIYPHQGGSPFSGLTTITKAPDGSIFLAGGFHGFDDGITNDTNQRMICKLYGLHVGVQEQQSVRDQLRVYPNPGNDVLYIHLSSRELPAKVELLDITGRKAAEHFLRTSDEGLDVSGLASGSYMVITRSQGIRRTTKWIKR